MLIWESLSYSGKGNSATYSGCRLQDYSLQVAINAGSNIIIHFETLAPKPGCYLLPFNELHTSRFTLLIFASSSFITFLS